MPAPGLPRALADALFAAADTRQPDLNANDALACLFDLGDPRAPALLAPDLRRRAQLDDFRPALRLDALVRRELRSDMER